MIPLTRLALVALLLALLAPAATASAATAAPFYTITDLGTFGGPESIAVAINDAGLVTGWADTTETYYIEPKPGRRLLNYVSHSFAWESRSAAGLRDITAVPCPAEPGTARAFGTALNERGDVAGVMPECGTGNHFIDHQGQRTYFSFNTGTYEQVLGINDQRQMIGTDNPTSPCLAAACDRAFVYDHERGDLRYLADPFGGGSIAYDINSAGLIVGEAHYQRGAGSRAVVWGEDDIRELPMLPGFGLYSRAVAINDAGLIAGYVISERGARRAFLLDPGGLHDLGTLPSEVEYVDNSEARGINAAGEVVGLSNGRAFLYTNGVMQDLNTRLPPDSGWRLVEANDINNLGQIVGVGQRDGSGQRRAFLLAPGFRDLTPGTPYRTAIESLASRDIIRGYEDGRFGPGDPVLRAQSAALIARSVGWEAEDWGDVDFPDRGSVDADLWRNVRTLAHYQVALGYDDGTYNPTGEVLHQQVLLFVARALVQKGYWQPQSDTNPYPNLPGATERERADRRDIATYVHYAGAVPGRPIGQAWADWDQPASRGWYAQVLWQALNPLPIP